MAPPPPACEPLQVKVTEDWSSGSGRETTTLGPPVTFSRIRVRGAAAASPCENLISSKSTTYRAHPAPCSGPRGPGWACSLPGSPLGLLSTTPGPGEAEPPGLPGVPTGGQSMRVVRPSGCAGNRTGGRGEGEAAVLPTPSHCTVSGGYQVHPPHPPAQACTTVSTWALTTGCKEMGPPPPCARTAVWTTLGPWDAFGHPQPLFTRAGPELCESPSVEAHVLWE